MSIIRNMEMIRQVVDFNGIGGATVYPSDVDAVIEIDDKYLILFEVKKKGNGITTGQRLLLERIANNWNGISYVLFCSHSIDTPEIISLKDCVVDKLYYNKEWVLVDESVSSVIDKIKNKWSIDKL